MGYICIRDALMCAVDHYSEISVGRECIDFQVHCFEGSYSYVRTLEKEFPTIEEMTVKIISCKR
jgi:hypothetical protein